MTFTLTEVLLLLITVMLLVLAGAAVVLGNRAATALSRFQETAERLNALEPQVRRVLESLEVELARVESLTAKTDRMADDVVTVTHESRRVALDLLRDLEEYRIPARYQAAVAGAKAGLSVLRAANQRRR